MRQSVIFLAQWAGAFVLSVWLLTKFSPWYYTGLSSFENILLHARQILFGQGLFLPLLGISLLFAVGWSIIARAMKY